MSLPDKLKLTSLKEEVLKLSTADAVLLQHCISETIKAFNYQDMKVHGHLNELYLTINTDKKVDAENFNDIRKKLIYLIDTVVTAD